MSISIIIPIYNERAIARKNITRTIEAIKDQFSDWEIIIIDDGSTDGIGEELEQLADEFPQIVLLKNHINLNVGVSIQRGFAVASKEFVMHNGADLCFAPEKTKSVVDRMILQNADVAVIERKNYAAYTPWRWIVSKVNRLIIRMLFGKTGVIDYNFMQFYKNVALKQIMPLAKSPAFTTPEIIFRAMAKKMRVVSIYEEFRAREVGSGAFGRPHDILWSLYDLIRFRYHFREFKKYQEQVNGPLKLKNATLKD